jgi:hypothetical protein
MTRHMLGVTPMRASQPDAFLLPLLLPIFLVGMFPLLILGVVGFLGLGILGLLILFIAVGDELAASSVYSRHVVTRAYLPAAERAAYRLDARAALRPAFLMKLAGAAMMAVGYGGFFLITVG